MNAANTIGKIKSNSTKIKEMKKILFIVMLLWSVPGIGQIKSASLTASGLTCSMCSKAIYKALLKMPSVKDVTVDIEKSKYDIKFKENVPVVIDDIKNAVTDAGFSVASMQVTANFDHVAVANDAHIALAGSNFHFLGVADQTLDGDRALTVVDKNYLSAKDFKKYSKYTQMKCVETGMMASCCAKNSLGGGRIYHVTL